MSARGVNLKMILPPHVSRYSIVVRITFTNLTELSVGGSTTDLMTGGLADNVVAKTYAKVFRGGDPQHHEIDEIVAFIPSSTLKGALRNLYEEKLKEESQCSASLSSVLEELLPYIRESHEIRNEIANKVISRVYMQFLDDNIVTRLTHMLAHSSESFEEFVDAISSGNSEAFERQLGELDTMHEVAEIIRDIANTYLLYDNVCDPTIEGLACELPVPAYKILLKAALLRVCRERDRQLTIEYPCKACRLFGLPGYRSRITVSNAWPTNVDDVVIMSRTHIAIDRVKGTVSQGKTYQVEYIVPGAEFEFYIAYSMQSTTLDDIGNLRNAIAAYLSAERADEGMLQGLIIGDLDKEFLRFLRVLIDSLRSGNMHIGRRKTLDYGRIGLRSYGVEIVENFGRANQGGRYETPGIGVPKPLADIRSLVPINLQGREP